MESGDGWSLHYLLVNAQTGKVMGRFKTKILGDIQRTVLFLWAYLHPRHAEKGGKRGVGVIFHSCVLTSASKKKKIFVPAIPSVICYGERENKPNFHYDPRFIYSRLGFSDLDYRKNR